MAEQDRNPETDVLDAIGELVDEQMAAGEPLTGYDYGDPTFPRCRCGWGWHGLPQNGCPGTDFEGPLAVATPASQSWREYLYAMVLANSASLWALPADPFLSIYNDIIVSDAEVREHLFLTGTMVYARGTFGRVPVGRVRQLEQRSPGSWRVDVHTERPHPRTLIRWETDADETRRRVAELLALDMPALHAAPAQVWPRWTLGIADGAPYRYGEYVAFDEGSRVGYVDRDGTTHVGTVTRHEETSRGWEIEIGYLERRPR
mgnify:CR=1 FL=1